MLKLEKYYKYIFILFVVFLAGCSPEDFSCGCSNEATNADTKKCGSSAVQTEDKTPCSFEQVKCDCNRGFSKDIEIISKVKCPDLKKPAAYAREAALPEGFQADFAIIQINDVYRIDELAGENDLKVGGLGRVVSVINDTLSEVGEVYVLHAGDFLSPSLETKYFHGLQMVEAMNFLNDLAPMYVVPGNHEFDVDDDPERLKDAIFESEFSWLSSNIELDRNFDPLDDRVDEAAIEIWGGWKVGIFALTIDTGGVTYASFDPEYAQIAYEKVVELDRRGADVIIGLTHLNMFDDKILSKLRTQTDKLIWIAGGHEHTAHCQSLSERRALVTKADSNARTIWRVYFGTQNGEFTIVPQFFKLENSAPPEDKSYASKISGKYYEELKEKKPDIYDAIGCTFENGCDKEAEGNVSGVKTCFDGSEEAVRNFESSWGNYITDRMLDGYPKPEGMDQETNLKGRIAFIHGGNLRMDEHICGEILNEHIERTFAYNTKVVELKLTGGFIKNHILENSVSELPGDGRFLQTSGLKYEYDVMRPKGNRITNVMVMNKDNQWDPLDEKGIYYVLFPKYLTDNEDGYDFRGQGAIPSPKDKMLEDVVLESIEAKDIVIPLKEGRICNKADHENNDVGCKN